MNAGKWVTAGLIGGLAGAFAWAAIVYFFQLELGWLAWGIGALVGYCVRATAGDEDKGPAPGVAALGLATFSIVLGKYLTVVVLLGGLTAGNAQPSEEIGKLELVNEQNEPAPYEAWADVPPEKQAIAERDWNALPSEEKQQRLSFQDTLERTATQEFLKSFWFDKNYMFNILWFLLAAGTAYRLGSGGE
jgi:hypothetical protein